MTKNKKRIGGTRPRELETMAETTQGAKRRNDKHEGNATAEVAEEREDRTISTETKRRNMSEGGQEKEEPGYINVKRERDERKERRRTTRWRSTVAVFADI